MHDMPKKNYNRVDIDLKVTTTPEEEAYVEQFLEAFEAASDDDGDAIRRKGKKNLSSLRRLLGIAKAGHKDTIAFIDSCVEAHDCAVVFFYHKAVRDILKEKLAHYRIVVHDGDTSAVNKQAAVDKFQAGKADIFLAQVEAAIGYTVTRAQDCIYIEYGWLPTDNEQAYARAYRYGQKKIVTGHYVVAARNTLDRKLITMMIKKQKGIDKLHDEKN